EETAALLRRYLHLSHESQVVVESKLLTDTTLERLSLQGLHAHVETVFSGPRSRPFAARLHTPMEHTVYLMFGVREEGEPAVPQGRLHAGLDGSARSGGRGRRRAAVDLSGRVGVHRRSADRVARRGPDEPLARRRVHALREPYRRGR